MARILPTISLNELKAVLALEGRPFKTSQKQFSNGSTDAYPFANIGGGDIVIDPGRAMFIESITVGSTEKGMLFGQMRSSTVASWIGDTLDDDFYVATNGAPVSIPINAIVREQFTISLRFTPFDSGSGTAAAPDLSLKVNGIEFTNDLNFDASKVLMYGGDSISWSLIGDWRPHDQFDNLIGFSDANTNFPSNHGDKLASFRLVNQLRQDGESIRLVNKGFGGSRLLKDQSFALRSGLYDNRWNCFVMQAGVNDAQEPMTPLRQLTVQDRIGEFVTRRNNNGRSKYPLVFCTTPSLDDRDSLTSSRNVMDVKAAASYDETASTTTADADAVLNLSAATNYTCSVSGDGTETITVTGGTEGAVYRIDFLTATTLSIEDNAHVTAYIRPLDVGIPGRLIADNGYDSGNGTLDIPANTVMYLQVTDATDLHYEEIERSTLITTSVSGATFDAGSTEVSNMENHFVCTHSSATKITGPDLSTMKQSSDVTAGSRARDYIQFNLDTGSTNPVKATNWPDSSSIDKSDVWVKVSGVSGTGVGIDWPSINGFYKVINYSTVSNNDSRVTQLDLLCDARQGVNREFGAGGLDVTSATVEHLDFRTYIAEFEGTSSSSVGSSAYFEDNTADATGNLIDSNNYQVRVNLKTASTFELSAGKGIAFGLYQEGNTIYMNEINSGDIVNTGSVTGALTYDAFYSQSEDGAMTRLFTINQNITTKVNTYSETADRVHLCNLYDASDMRNTTVSTGGRVKYGASSTFSVYNSGFASRNLRVGDVLEDTAFKKSGDTGSNESTAGSRLHRSPYGHELLYNRLYTTIGASSFTIPS